MNRKRNVSAIGPNYEVGDIVDVGVPYSVQVHVRGTSDLLFHRWSCDENEEGNRKRKGSKKFPEPDTFLYRDEKNEICIPSEHFRQAVIHAAKYRKDPRSSRKSLRDVCQAGIICEEPQLIPLGKDKPDYYHKCRVNIQRNSITRIRPAFLKGWECKIVFTILLSEYISEELFNEILIDAGRLCGVGDFRPTYGRFQVIQFKKIN